MGKKGKLASPQKAEKNSSKSQRTILSMFKNHSGESTPTYSCNIKEGSSTVLATGTDVPPDTGQTHGSMKKDAILTGTSKYFDKRADEPRRSKEPPTACHTSPRQLTGPFHTATPTTDSVHQATSKDGRSSRLSLGRRAKTIHYKSPLKKNKIGDGSAQSGTEKVTASALDPTDFDVAGRMSSSGRLSLSRKRKSSELEASAALTGKAEKSSAVITMFNTNSGVVTSRLPVFQSSEDSLTVTHVDNDGISVMKHRGYRYSMPGNHTSNSSTSGNPTEPSTTPPSTGPRVFGLLANSTGQDSVSLNEGNTADLSLPECPSQSSQKENKTYCASTSRTEPSLPALFGEDETRTRMGTVHCNESQEQDVNIRQTEDSTSQSVAVQESAAEEPKRDVFVAEMQGPVEAKDEGRSGEEEGTEGTDDSQYRVPYYLENFALIVNTVLNDDYYSYLFNTDDRAIVTSFQKLSEDGQKVYVRLFQRQYRWLRKVKISYPKIAPDLTPLLQQNIDAGLLTSEEELVNLEDILKALPAPDLKSLAKTLRINPGLQKDSLASAILKHSRRTNIGAFFASAGNKGTEEMVIKRAKTMLGQCYKLNKEPRAVFMRIMMLFGLHRTRGDDDENGGQQQLFQILMSNIGLVTYPQYTICRRSRIFKDRDSLLQYGTAMQLEADMEEALEVKDWELATRVYQDAAKDIHQHLADADVLRYDQSLPDFLRVFTTASIFTRILSMRVELLQYQKKYREAVQQLEELIQQSVYLATYRGRWYDRAALNMDFHLKEHNKALDVIQKALSDPRIQTGHRYALLQRARKICTGSTKNKWLRQRLNEFTEDPMSGVVEAPKVTIQGRQLPQPGSMGHSLYISEESLSADGADVTYIKRVEDVALVHYKQNGYPEGLHGEGATFRCLFGFLMWDVLFLDGIPDVFYNLYQTCPLDLASDHFYSCREDAITSRLHQIKHSSIDEVSDMVGECWELHKDTFCIGVRWDMFDSVAHAQGLARCMGGPVLAGILERMARNMRHTTGGVPDLCVWNPDTLNFKMVEVKGPGDRLSTKQILWLDHLLALKVDAEVCHVEAVGAKKLAKQASAASSLCDANDGGPQ